MADPLCVIEAHLRVRHSAYDRWLVLLVMLTSVALSRSGELDFANGLYRQEKFQLAAEEYEQYLTKNPAGPEEDQARFYLGESLLQLRRLKEASQSFQKVWEKSQSVGDSVRGTMPPNLFFVSGRLRAKFKITRRRSIS